MKYCCNSPITVEEGSCIFVKSNHLSQICKTIKLNCGCGSVEIGATEMKVLRKEILITKLDVYLTTKWFVQMFFGTLKIRVVAKIVYQNETLVFIEDFNINSSYMNDENTY